MIGIQMGDESHECNCHHSCFDEIHYLVINKNKEASFLPFNKQFRVFTSKTAAIQYAQSIGYEKNFIGVSDQPGMASIYMAGDVNVMILPLKGE